MYRFCYYLKKKALILKDKVFVNIILLNSVFLYTSLFFSSGFSFFFFLFSFISFLVYSRHTPSCSPPFSFYFWYLVAFSVLYCSVATKRYFCIGFSSGKTYDANLGRTKTLLAMLLNEATYFHPHQLHIRPRSRNKKMVFSKILLTSLTLENPLTKVLNFNMILAFRFHMKKKQF